MQRSHVQFDDWLQFASGMPLVCHGMRFHKAKRLFMSFCSWHNLKSIQHHPSRPGIVNTFCLEVQFLPGPSCFCCRRLSCLRLPHMYQDGGRGRRNGIDCSSCSADLQANERYHRRTPYSSRRFAILLMEEIPHHLSYMKSYETWDILNINWCRISSINSIYIGDESIYTLLLMCVLSLGCKASFGTPCQHLGMEKRG